MGENYNIGDLVGLIDPQNVSVKVKCAEVYLLPGVEAPSLTAIEQHTDNAHNIDCSFVCTKFSVLLESQGQPGKHGDSSPDLSLDLSV